MRRGLLPGQRNDDWVGSSLRKKAQFSSTRSASYPRKLKLRYCTYCRSGSFSVWVGISLSERTRGSSLLPIATWKLLSPRGHFAATCFTVSMFFRLRFLLCGKEKKIFPSWSNTSSTVSQERLERASAGRSE